MLQQMIKIDNFFSEQELTELLTDAEKYPYYQKEEHPGWASSNGKANFLGVRTENLLTLDFERYRIIVDKIIGKAIQTTFGVMPKKLQLGWTSQVYFHKLDNQFGPEDDFDPKWFHQDTFAVYAGVVYLGKKPVAGTGTVIRPLDGGSDIVVENTFNRLAIYNGQLVHSVQNGSPDRLTLTCFIDELNIFASNRT